MGTLVCVSELKPAFIFLPSASPLRPDTCTRRLEKGSGGSSLAPDVPAMNCSQEQMHGEGATRLRVPGGGCNGLFART